MSTSFESGAFDFGAVVEDEVVDEEVVDDEVVDDEVVDELVVESDDLWVAWWFEAPAPPDSTIVSTPAESATAPNTAPARRRVPDVLMFPLLS